MSDPNNGVLSESSPVVRLDLLISWYPLEHRFEVKGTSADIVVQLGMLQMASAQILQQQAVQKSGLVMPNFVLKDNGKRQ